VLLVAIENLVAGFKTRLLPSREFHRRLRAQLFFATATHGFIRKAAAAQCRVLGDPAPALGNLAPALTLLFGHWLMESVLLGRNRPRRVAIAASIRFLCCDAVTRGMDCEKLVANRNNRASFEFSNHGEGERVTWKIPFMEMTYGHQALRSLPPQLCAVVGNGYGSNINAFAGSGPECDVNAFD
jgi:hypothetical protein